jgi:hypothetical protein
VNGSYLFRSSFRATLIVAGNRDLEDVLNAGLKDLPFKYYTYAKTSHFPLTAILMEDTPAYNDTPITPAAGLRIDRPT